MFTEIRKGYQLSAFLKRKIITLLYSRKKIADFK